MKTIDSLNFHSLFMWTYICMHKQTSVFFLTFVYITQAEISQSLTLLSFTLEVFWGC